MQKLDEQILNIIRNAGPSTPMEIASRINGTDSLIVGAVLADAASQKKIKKSNDHNNLVVIHVIQKYRAY